AAMHDAADNAPFLAQQLDGAVEGIALADTAEVDLDRAAKCHAAIFGIKRDVCHADARHDFGALAARRDATRAAIEAPGLHESADGDIESTCGGAAQPFAQGEQAE